MNKKTGTTTILILIIVLICAILYSISFILGHENRPQGLYTAQYVFPVIAILAIIASVLTLALVSIVFASFQQQPSQHALGMPQGSIRALIALALLTSFIITAVFLFSTINDQSTFQQNNVTPEQLKTLNIKDYRIIDTNKVVLSTSPILDPTGKPVIDTVTKKPRTIKVYEDKSYSIDIYSPVNEESSDFAKQLLAVLGTLVIAVCSFYFGSRSTEQGSALASEIINGAVITSDKINASSTTKLIPKTIIEEAIRENKDSWLTTYGANYVLVGKKEKGDTTSYIDCITFVVNDKNVVATGAKSIPTTIRYTASDGVVYDIPTDVI